MDFTLTHTRFKCAPYWTTTHTRRSDGDPEPDCDLKTVTRVKIIHYRQLYLNRPDPIVFMSVTVDTSGRIYDDFIVVCYFYTLTVKHRP
jgi:hypothetical protein